MACDPNTLAGQAACLTCIPAGMQDAVIISLLCAIRDAGGGGGGGATPQVIAGAFANPNGNVTPATPTLGAIYYQDSAPVVNQWQWSVASQNWFQVTGP